MGFISIDRSQTHLLGYRVEDFARSDTKGRFILQMVSRLNLDSLLARYSTQGGDSYAPDMMLALWFYAYSNGITSTRQLEEHCTYDTRYIYISGNTHPDHTTLSRFRQAHLDLLSEYFLQLVLIADEKGITDFRHISIDGTKIKASAASRHNYNEDQLKRKIEAIQTDIKEYMLACAMAEQGIDETLDLATLQAEKKRLEELEKKLLERQDQLQTRKKKLKAEHRGQHSINLVDPDARLMAKISAPGYNAQIAVSDDHNFIVANDVTDEPNDHKQFSSMYEKAESHLTQDNKRGYTADSGYHSLKQLEYIEENGIDAVIADPTPDNRSISKKPLSVESILEQGRKLKRKDFTYHAPEDYYECPAGQQLIPVRKKGKSVIYRAGDCSSCLLRQFCLPGKSKVKQLLRDRREGLAEEMSRKLTTEEAKHRMKSRATSAEPVFGNLKQNLGFRSFSLRGIPKVKGEFNLMCIAHNLNILFKMMYPHGLTAKLKTSRNVLNQHIVISKNIMAILFYKLSGGIQFPGRRKYAILFC